MPNTGNFNFANHAEQTVECPAFMEKDKRTDEASAQLEAFLDDGLRCGGATPLQKAFRELEKKYDIPVM